jgi:ribosomal protein S27AE
MAQTRAVTCEKCGTADMITEPADPDIEVRWQCGAVKCRHLNYIEGHPGELGEGGLNPAASALTDEQLLEAAVRRGLATKVEVDGETVPAGDSKTVAAPSEGDQQ